MAKGRLLAKIGGSKKVTSASDWAFRVWGTCGSYCDRDGRLPFDATELAAECFQLMVAREEISHRDVAEGRDELIRIGLWAKLVDDDGVPFIHIIGFLKSQSGDWRRSREPESVYRYSGIDPESCRQNGGASPPESADVPPQSESEYESKREAEAQEPARARMSEDRAEKAPTHPGDLQTAATDKDRLRAEFRLALGNPDWKGSGIDWNAAKENARFLSNLKDRPGQLARALEVVRSDGKAHTHILADVIQLLVAGLPTARAAPGAPKPYEIPLTTKPWEAIGLTEEEYRSAGGRA